MIYAILAFYWVPYCWVAWLAQKTDDFFEVVLIGMLLGLFYSLIALVVMFS